MGRISRKVKIKLGTDEHTLKPNLSNHQGCINTCSLRSLCFDMGQTQRMTLCDAVISEVYDYRDDFSPFGGHFELTSS